MNRKQLTYLFAALVILIGGSVIYYFFFRDECDPNNNGFTKKGKLSDKCTVKNPSSTNTAPPSGTQWVSDTTFPIKKGSWGSRVKALQKAIGLSTADQDGRFGGMTESALQAKTGKSEIPSQQEYDAIVNPPATGGGSNYSKLKASLGSGAENFSGGVYRQIQGQNKNYQVNFFTNGRFTLTEYGVTGVIKKGTYLDGAKKMIVDAGDTFQSSAGVYGNMRDIVNKYGQ